MRRRFFTMSIVLAVIAILCMTFGHIQSTTTYAAEQATVQAVPSEGSLPVNLAGSVVQKPACRTAAAVEQQGANPFANRAAPLQQYVCCNWVYWCDYYSCYYYEECWYC